MLAKKSRQAITLEQKIKVLEALQRGNGASSVGHGGDGEKNKRKKRKRQISPQTVGKELTIPKLREFMQHVTSATQSALQHDPDMERSMQVVEALNRAASTYSQLLDQLIMAQQQKKITSFFRPLSSSGEFVMKPTPEVAGPSTSGQTQPSSSTSCVSDVLTATPLHSDVDDEMVELGSASSEDELPN
ncbi:hypothetical protein Hamer_G014581 [Homarus americanus]|uniref:Uncharacterized protein n=1 Tax=Homarus americanus TaxID=6706 RepID=A0A8J5N4H3_HOMAM|nr:hypothetical protein Hamer_G014581 [Homarus americanus]